MTARQKPAPADEILTPTEVADLFGVRTYTLTRWVREGRIPPEAIVRTIGGHRRYRAAHIRALLAGRTPTGRGGA